MFKKFLALVAIFSTLTLTGCVNTKPAEEVTPAENEAVIEETAEKAEEAVEAVEGEDAKAEVEGVEADAEGEDATEEDEKTEE